MQLKHLVVTTLLLGLVACSRAANLPALVPTQATTQAPIVATQSQETATVTPTLDSPRLLSICLINEPRSLFLYDAASTSELNVLAAIYDGPIDIKNFIPQPVILEKLPSLTGGDASLQVIDVSPGDLIVDGLGNVNNLGEGILYRPSGCSAQECVQTYSGTEAAQMDQLVLRFKLLAGIEWSDGTPLTAGDSVYSYEVARSLYPAAVPDQVSRTASYKALDDQSVEWVGLPGFVDGQYQTKFYTPLPQHAWAGIPVNELSSDEVSSRKPLGWGAYMIDDWIAGDHITLHANPLYFRSDEGLPHFENLVYRFVSNIDEAQSVLKAGECDLVDQVAGLEAQTASLLQMNDEGSVSLILQEASAWEVLQFGISSVAPDRPVFFADRNVRQAVAMCIDRQALVDQLSGGHMQVANLYIPVEHPLYNSQARNYAIDREAAAALLTAAGWVDDDTNPSTPRIAQGAVGVADGTAFAIQYLVSDNEENQAAARRIQENLAACGIQAEIISQPVEVYLAAGPGGPVFGRQFDLAQFGWLASVEPPCSLFLTSEIPAEYPASPKGWGGVNASGYSNPEFDQACLDALYSLADTPQHGESHATAQAIFAEDLPALPLYWHYRVVIGRPDMCGLPTDGVTENIFSDLELFNYGENCP